MPSPNQALTFYPDTEGITVHNFNLLMKPRFSLIPVPMVYRGQSLTWSNRWVRDTMLDRSGVEKYENPYRFKPNQMAGT